MTTTTTLDDLTAIRLDGTDALIYCYECDREYLESVQQAAAEMGKGDQLLGRLTYLAQYACWKQTDDGDQVPGDFNTTRCVLCKDWAPLSFSFVMHQKTEGGYRFWFNGGLIFHGQHDGFGDGSAPTYSVDLSSTDGWSIHT